MSIQFRTRTRGISVPTEEVFGACCYNVEGDLNNCADNTSLQTCIDTNGIFLGNLSTCENDACNSGARLGSCCINGFCYQLDEIPCNNRGGSWQEGTSCVDRNCCSEEVLSEQYPEGNNSTARQSCCYPDGTCAFVTPCLCVKTGGLNGGFGSNCATPCFEQSQFRGSCCVQGHCVGPMGDLTGDHDAWSVSGYTSGGCRDIFAGIFGGSGTTCGGHDTNGNNDIAGVTWPCVFPKGSCCFGNTPFNGDGIDPGKSGVIYCDGGRTAGHTAGTCLGTSGGQAFAPFKTCAEIEQADEQGGNWNPSDGEVCYDNTSEECFRCRGPKQAELGICCIPNVYESFDYNDDNESDYIFVKEYSCLDDLDIETCDKLDGLWKSYICENEFCDGDNNAFGERLRCEDDDFVCCEMYKSDFADYLNYENLNLSCNIPNGSCCTYDGLGNFLNCFDDVNIIDCETLTEESGITSVSFQEDGTCGLPGEGGYLDTCNPQSQGVTEVNVGDSCCKWEWIQEGARWSYSGCEDISESYACVPTGNEKIAKRGATPCNFVNMDACSGLLVGACVGRDMSSCENTWESNCSGTFYPLKECFYHGSELPGYIHDVDPNVSSYHMIYQSFGTSPIPQYFLDQQSVNFYLPPLTDTQSNPILTSQNGADVVQAYFEEFFPDQVITVSATMMDYPFNGGAAENSGAGAVTANRSRINVSCFGDQIADYRTEWERGYQGMVRYPIADFGLRPWSTFAEAFLTQPVSKQYDEFMPGNGFSCSYTGACCYPNPEIPCDIVTREECEDLSGYYRGPGTSCSECQFDEETQGCCCAQEYGGFMLTESECSELRTNASNEQFKRATWLGPGIKCTDWDGTNNCEKYTGRCCCSDGTGVIVPEDGDENANLLNCLQISAYENINYNTCTSNSLTAPTGDPSLIRCMGEGTFELGKSCCDAYSSVWDEDTTGAEFENPNKLCDNCMLASSDYGERGACCSGVGWCGVPEDCFINGNAGPNIGNGDLLLGCTSYEVGSEDSSLRNGGWGGYDSTSQNPNGPNPICYDELTQNECISKTEYWRGRGWSDVEFIWLGTGSKCKHSGVDLAIRQHNESSIDATTQIDPNTAFVSTDPDGVSNFCSGCLFGWSCGSSDVGDLYCGGVKNDSGFGDCYGLNYGGTSLPGQEPRKLIGHIATWNAPTVTHNQVCDTLGIESAECEISTSRYGDRWQQRFFYRTESCIQPADAIEYESGYPATSTNGTEADDFVSCPFCNANVVTNAQLDADVDGPGQNYNGPLRNTYFRFGFDHINGPNMCSNLGKVGDGSANNDENYGCFGQCCIDGKCHRWPMRVCVEELGGLWKGCGTCPEDNVCISEEDDDETLNRTGDPNYFYCIGNCDGDEIGNNPHAGPCCFGDLEYDASYNCDQGPCSGVEKCKELGGYVLRTDNYPTELNMTSWCSNFACSIESSSNRGDVVGVQKDANTIRELKETGYSNSFTQPDRRNYSDYREIENYSICANGGCNDTTYSEQDPIENYLCGCACCYPYTQGSLPTCLDVQTRADCENSGGICSGFYGQCESGVLNCDVPSNRSDSQSGGIERSTTDGQIDWSPPRGEVQYEPFITGFRGGPPSSLTIPFLGFNNIFEGPVLGHGDSRYPLVEIPNIIYYRVGCQTDWSDGSPLYYNDSDLPFPIDPSTYMYIVGAKKWSDPDGYCSNLEIGFDTDENGPYGEGGEQLLYTEQKNNIHELWLTKYHTPFPHVQEIAQTLEPTFIAQLHKGAVPNLRKLVLNPARYGNNRFGIAGTTEEFWRNCELGSCLDPLVPYVSGQLLSNDLSLWRSTLEDLTLTDANVDNASLGIGYLEFSNYTNLRSLHLHNNNLDTLILTNLPALEHLWVQNNNLGNVGSWQETPPETAYRLTLGFPKLKTVNAQNNNIKHLDVSLGSGIVSIDVSNNPELSSINFATPTPRLEYLDISGCAVNNVDIQDAPELKVFSAINADNNISNLNNLSAFNIDQPPVTPRPYYKLEEIHITNSNIGVNGTLDLTKYKNIKRIVLQGNINLSNIRLPNPDESFNQPGLDKEYIRLIDLRGTSVNILDLIGSDAVSNYAAYPENHTLEIDLRNTSDAVSTAILSRITATVQSWAQSGRNLIVYYDYDNSIFVPS